MARDPHEIALGETPHHGSHFDAANVLDLGTGDGLLVGDDRERLECRAAEPCRTLLLELPDVARQILARAHLVAAGDLPDLDAALLLRVVVGELGDERASLRRLQVRCDLCQLGRRDRLRGRQDQGLDDLLLSRAFHAPLYMMSAMPSAQFEPGTS